MAVVVVVVAAVVVVVVVVVEVVEGGAVEFECTYSHEGWHPWQERQQYPTR